MGVGAAALHLAFVGGLVCMALATAPAHATPHPGQSVNVVIIGGTTLDPTCYGHYTDANYMWDTFGGCLRVTGLPGELGDFSFAPMAPGAVSTASLASFDTAVLNVASGSMACNTNTLSPAQQADLVAFVGTGKKLIIYDSECWPGPVDYSWLPYPFTTANPGALGQQGTLTIVEDNLLSTLVGDPSCLLGDPHCIDVAYLGPNTDAVGDMNVMTTLDPRWCVDMSGTNAISVTGAVHTYADFPAGTDAGLIIYNGLDMDYLEYYGDPDLRKIWVQELQQPFNPSGLPCLVPVLGIGLDPDSDENEVGEDHTVTATLTDLLGSPQPDILVTFTVISGPNAGASGTCSVNADCTTDANGEVSWTYTGSGGVGTDEIEGCFTNSAGDPLCNQVTKDWVAPPNVPPVCDDAVAAPGELWPPNHTLREVSVAGVTDPDGDPVAITITSIRQDEPLNGVGDGNTCPDGTGVGMDTASVRAERSGSKKVPGDGRVYHVGFSADDGQSGTCEGTVAVCVPHDQRPGHVCVDQGALFDSTSCP